MQSYWSCKLKEKISNSRRVKESKSGMVESICNICGGCRTFPIFEGVYPRNEDAIRSDGEKLKGVARRSYWSCTPILPPFDRRRQIYNRAARSEHRLRKNKRNLETRAEGGEGGRGGRKRRRREKERKIFDCIGGRNKESAACLARLSSL